MAQLATVPGYALVVAFTMLPVLTVISGPSDTGPPERGWQLTSGYAGGLVALLILAAFGLGGVSLPRFRDAGGVEIVGGCCRSSSRSACSTW
jgi:hypothetical protein